MSIIEILTNAIVTGIGVTIGSYLANRTFIKNLEKVLKLKKEGN